MKNIRYTLLILAIFASQSLISSSSGCRNGICSAKGQPSAKSAKPKKVSSNDKRVNDTLNAVKNALQKMNNLMAQQDLDLKSADYILSQYNPIMLDILTNLSKLKNLDKKIYEQYKNNFYNNFKGTFVMTGFDENPDTAFAHMMTYYTKLQHLANKQAELEKANRQYNKAMASTPHAISATEKQVKKVEKELEKMTKETQETKIGHKTILDIDNERRSTLEKDLKTQQSGYASDSDDEEPDEL